MSQSITRKFLVKKLPDLSNKEKTMYERYYMYVANDIVIRIQAVNDRYELERKVNQSDLIREGHTLQITKQEFDELRKIAKKSIVRDSYHVADNPTVVLRMYHGEYEGLQRAEVNFHTKEEALQFTPYEWFGKEITGTALSQDGLLLQLTKEEFQRLLYSDLPKT